jgi:transcription elongation factor Elf1
MEEFADIQCPFCGQTFGVTFDTSITNQRFISDCEVCCRPFEVSVTCDEDGEIVSLEVSGG